MSENGLAVVFPGQGSQRPGMAKDFHDCFAVAREVYLEASAAIEFDLAGLTFGEDPRLDLTEFTQPAILTAEIAMWRAISSHWGVQAAVFGGHSLGEYTALVAAGVMRLADAVRLVRRRGALMQEAVPAGEGAMLAVVGRGLELEALRAELEGLEVDAANHNSPSQIVVSGRKDGVEEARAKLSATKGRRLIPLNVSAPFHSRFMKRIEPVFERDLGSAPWNAEGGSRVASNYTGTFHVDDSAAIRQSLVRQISGTVRWVDNMKALLGRASRVVEIGPGKPLTGFFKELGVAVTPVTSLETAEAAFGGAKKGAGE